jgi:hypothetical protein
MEFNRGLIVISWDLMMFNLDLIWISWDLIGISWGFKPLLNPMKSQLNLY